MARSKEYNRDTANNTLFYKRAVRDSYIDQNGMIIKVILPVVRNIDAYGDLVYAVGQDTIEKRTSVIPKYQNWRMIMDVVGFSIENPIPLEIIVRSDFDYPRGTKLIIPIDEQNKEWKVLSSSINHLDFTHDKIVKVVPWRYIGKVESKKVEKSVRKNAETDKMIQGFDLNES